MSRYVAGLVLAAWLSAQVSASPNDKPKADKLPGGAIARLQPSKPLKNGRVVSVALTADGKTVAAALVGRDDTAVCIWERVTGKQLLRLGGFNDWVRTVAFSPDDKLLVVQTRSEIQLVDTATGKQRRRFTLDYHFLSSFALAPDGKTLAIGEGGFRKANEPFQIRLFDLDTGKELRRFGAHPTRIDTLAFSADGKKIASSSTEGGTFDGGEEVIPGVSRVWDVATGKKLHDVKVGGKVTGLTSFEKTSVAFSPDMRRLAHVTESFNVQLLAVATGKSMPLGEDSPATNVVALAGDGRLLATGHGGFPLLLEDGKQAAGGAEVVLWEVMTAKALYRFAGYPLTIYCAAFAPDCKILAAGHNDNTVLLWDVARLYHGVKPATAEELPKLWTALGDLDPVVGHRVVEQLASAPAVALPWLQTHLQPLAPADPKHLAQLVADLGHEQFAVRQKASVALQNLKEVAEPALRDALEQKLSIELHTRVQLLLDKLDPGFANPEGLRQSRAVLALERIANDDARLLLERIAGGVWTARLTQEARAALMRIRSSRP